MRVSTMIMSLGLAWLTFAAGITQAQTPAPTAQGPWSGIWTLNVETSSNPNGDPAAETLCPDSFIFVVIDSKSAGSGQSMHMELRGGKFDGEDYPETGNPIADASRFKILNERSHEIIETKKR